MPTAQSPRTGAVTGFPSQGSRRMLGATQARAGWTRPAWFLEEVQMLHCRCVGLLQDELMLWASSAAVRSPLGWAEAPGSPSGDCRVHVSPRL